MEGWIKLHRSLQKWGWKKSPYHTAVFVDLLLEANHKDNMYKGVLVPKGSLTTSIKAISARSGVTEKRVRTVLTHLKQTNELAIKTTPQYTMISIVKWVDYQLEGEEEGKQRANEGQTKGKQRATNKNVIMQEGKNNTLSEVGLFEIEQPSLDEDINASELSTKVLTALNTICFRSFRPRANTLKPINARINEGYSYEDFVAVITYFQKKWGNDPKFSDYLQPSTLFNTKFDERLEQSKNALKPKLDPLDVLAEKLNLPGTPNTERIA